MLLLGPWVRNGTFSPALAALGVAVLLVDLLTTGGIGIPAIAQSLWLLLALGLNGAWPREAPQAVVFALLVVGLGLFVACHQTSYARVLPSESFQRLARHEYLDGHRQSAQTDAAGRRCRSALFGRACLSGPDRSGGVACEPRIGRLRRL